MPAHGSVFMVCGLGVSRSRLLLFLLSCVAGSSAHAAVDLSAIASANADVLLLGGAVFGVHVLKAGYKWLRSAVLFEDAWDKRVGPPEIKGQTHFY